MAKIISLASSKVRAIQNGYEITDPGYVEALLADTTSVIGGVSKGQFLFVKDGVRYYLVYITGDQTFANLPKVFEVQPLAAPVLSSPADNAIEVAIDATLSWAAVDGAVSYELEFNDEVIPLSTTSYDIDVEYESVNTWRVRAIGPEIPGTWSASRTFTADEEDNG